MAKNVDVYLPDELLSYLLEKFWYLPFISHACLSHDFIVRKKKLGNHHIKRINMFI